MFERNKWKRGVNKQQANLVGINCHEPEHTATDIREETFVSGYTRDLTKRNQTKWM